MRLAEVNGGPGALYLDAQQRLIAVMALEIAGGQITGISSIVNPDKLTHLGPVGDFDSLLRSAGYHFDPWISPRTSADSPLPASFPARGAVVVGLPLAGRPLQTLI